MTVNEIDEAKRIVLYKTIIFEHFFFDRYITNVPVALKDDFKYLHVF